MVQIRRVLCPVDFSDHARHALDYASAVARWYGATISVLYVRPLATPIFAAGPYVGAEAFPPMSMTEAERHETRKALEAFVADDRAAGVSVDALVIEDLNVTTAITDQARALGADLLVMGTHGRSGFQRLLLGSVTERVMRTAECPVLTVPPRAVDSVPRSPVAIERITCGVDFSDASAHALTFAASLAGLCQATLTVVHVLELLPDTSDLGSFDMSAYRASRFDDAKARISTLLTPAITASCRTQELLIGGKPGREILRVAADQQSDVIVLGTHGRAVVERLFFGSAAAHVVRHATCPVITVR